MGHDRYRGTNDCGAKASFPIKNFPFAPPSVSSSRKPKVKWRGPPIEEMEGASIYEPWWAPFDWDKRQQRLPTAPVCSEGSGMYQAEAKSAGRNTNCYSLLISVPATETATTSLFRKIPLMITFALTWSPR